MTKLSTRSITHLCWWNWRMFWKENSRPGKVTQVVLFLQDNDPSHLALATQKELADLSFQCLDHPPYSPDLTPSDYHLFPGLKKQLKGRHQSGDRNLWKGGEQHVCLATLPSSHLHAAFSWTCPPFNFKTVGFLKLCWPIFSICPCSATAVRFLFQ